MNILMISGSSRTESTNRRFLETLPELFPSHRFQLYAGIDRLPLFRADDDHAPWPPSVLDWRKEVAQTDAVIISTPEYIYNLPAVIKNALEWIASSGELVGKPVLPLTLMPNAPRGAKAMQSLLWSLKALDANVVGQLDLYQQEITFEKEQILFSKEIKAILKDAVELLGA